MPDQVTIKIVMTAPSRVGKTSLLAAMAARIDKEVSEGDLGFRLLEDTSSVAAHLQQSRDRLEEMATGSEMTTDVTLGPEPSQDKREFPFTLSRPSDPGIPKLRLHFVDLPGEWYVGRGETEVADKLLQEADVIVVAVDAVALMEDKGKYNKRINNPKLICDNILRKCTEREKAPEVLVVAVKAETYLRRVPGKSVKSKLGEEDLKTKLSESYASLKVLRERGAAVKACAVETVGNIVFNDLRDDGTGLPIVTFRRVAAGYDPRYCSVPLRWVIGQILQAGKKKTAAELTVFDRIASAIGLGTKRTNAIEKLHELFKTLSESTADGRKVSEVIFDV